MGTKTPKLPKTNKIFDLNPMPLVSWTPIEWVIDWPYIAKIRDDRIIEAVTKIKMDYIVKATELQNQMRNDLAKAIKIQR